MKASIATEKFLVQPGTNVNLDDWPTTVTAFYKPDNGNQKLVEENG